MGVLGWIVGGFRVAIKKAKTLHVLAFFMGLNGLPIRKNKKQAIFHLREWVVYSPAERRRVRIMLCF